MEEVQKIRIVKKNDIYSLEYQIGDVFAVDSTWYGGVNVTSRAGIPISLDKEEYELLQEAEADTADGTGTGQRELDHYSYELGVMDAFCEMVHAGLKTLAMSHPCDTREERDGYLKDVIRLCSQYEVKFYKEDEAFLTELFPPELNRDKYNYLFFRTDDVLEQYLQLKSRQKRMMEKGTYTRQAAIDIAVQFGRLLSYPEEGIERLLKYQEREDVLKNMTEDFFPDGTRIDPWFYDIRVPDLEELGRQYVLTQHGILDDGRIHTQQIQDLIDTAAKAGGGVIVVPAGTYLTGSLFFRQGVHLYVSEGGTLKGSDDISDYKLCETRIEGETCKYFAALINADGLDGFTMCGPGVIDGSGLRSWKAFWLRREWNPKCTNKDEQRPRLVYISNSRNVMVAGLHLQNSHFWTNHIYKSSRVKYLGCHIFSPAGPVKSPSTDAIDIDVCTDFLVKNCYMEVNDDAVVLKGGKGPWADSAPENGSNERVIVEDCTYGFCHACLTCGSESVHNRNIIFRRGKVTSGYNLLCLKMRPDTPQHYEYITVEDIEAKVANFISINPWTQFYDRKGREDIPLSMADHIIMRDCVCECDTYFNVAKKEDQYRLSDFTFENLRIIAKESRFDAEAAENMTVKNVRVEEK